MHGESDQDKDTQALAVFPYKGNTDVHPLAEGVQRHDEYDEQDRVGVGAVER